MSNLSSNRIYPNASPEFRLLNKQDGTVEMQVRYINTAMGYTSQWNPVSVKNENTSSQS
jgi:hypothetical protein